MTPEAVGMLLSDLHSVMLAATEASAETGVQVLEWAGRVGPGAMAIALLWWGLKVALPRAQAKHEERLTKMAEDFAQRFEAQEERHRAQLDREREDFKAMTMALVDEVRASRELANTVHVEQVRMQAEHTAALTAHTQALADLRNTLANLQCPARAAEEFRSREARHAG
ncbi:MAG: hypothetical protein ACPGQD_01280 [Planctomycetota bacterium]